MQNTKVLHDYAFNLALQALDDGDLLLELDDGISPRAEGVPIPDAAFVLVTDTLSIVDYSSLLNILNRENALELFGLRPSRATVSSVQLNRQQHRNRQFSAAVGERGAAPVPSEDQADTTAMLKTLIDTFYGDVIEIKMTSAGGLNFTGSLSRELLREDIRTIIYKYGSKPQGLWHMLAQVCRVTGKPEHDLGGALQALTLQSPPNSIANLSDVFDVLLGMLNDMQQLISSVSYPELAVAPVAVYREIESIR